MTIPELFESISMYDGNLKIVNITGDSASVAFERYDGMLVTIHFKNCLLLIHCMYDYDLGDIIVSQGSELYNQTLTKHFEEHEIGTSTTTIYYEVNIYGVFDDNPIMTIIASEAMLE